MGDFFTTYRDPEILEKLAKKIGDYKGRKINIMEVCGTHTMAISRYGIRSLLPESINLISGPGCPVCVTPVFFINAAINLSSRKDTIITTFGDLMRVPGSESNLLQQKALGRDVRVVYSPLDSIKIAKQNKDKNVVFLSVGFETTTPISALTVLNAKDEGLKNFSVLSANKTVPVALEVLAMDEDIGIDGYLYPGHVSAIIGTGIYEELARKHRIPGVVAGFEPLDILNGIIRLSENINQNNIVVENAYQRAVSKEGNPIAVSKMYEVYEPCDSVWRGIGNLPMSGLKIRDEYKEFDAWKVFELEQKVMEEPKGCLCGEILKGKKKPSDCLLFGKACVPESPVGACMVSSEGTCAAYYKYNF